jgi:hypothetical protein
MVKQVYITIHHALHSDAAVVTIGKIDYPILKAPSGCRYVDYQGIRVMEQNKYKDSKWARMARAGHKISWAMTQPAWIRIDEQTINLPKTTTANATGRQTQSTPPTNSGASIRKKDSGRTRRGFWQ